MCLSASVRASLTYSTSITDVFVCVCQGEFDVQSQLPNVVPDPASLELGSEYYCEPGKVVFGDQCGKQRTGAAGGVRTR